MLTLQEIEMAAAEFCRDNPLNRAEELQGVEFFGQPIFGVAAADDNIFTLFQNESVIGPRHMTPRQWLDGSRAVLSYFLPFTPEVRQANRVMGLPAKEWLYGRIEGEAFNKALTHFLVEWLQSKGHSALAPAADPRIKVVERRSNWSERHAAYAAGLGTFSLSASLITRKGAAGRLGSVITDGDLEVTPRSYTAFDENCNKCGACILRCPPLAVTEKGKDHAVCSGYLDRVLARFSPRYGCGKCQTGTPCEGQIPARTLQASENRIQ